MAFDVVGVGVAFDVVGVGVAYDVVGVGVAYDVVGVLLLPFHFFVSNLVIVLLYGYIIFKGKLLHLP